MSKIDNLVRSKGYKNFMSKLYGWGASAVIIGALFKINHWPGAVPMLILGMGTESLIFFLSAFEPLHIEWDWSLVYPELAGMKGDDVNIGEELTSESVTEELDKMLADAKIGPDLVQRLGQGMENLANSANSLNNMTTSVSATEKFVTNMDVAAEAVNDLSAAYKRTTDSINHDFELSSSYSESLKGATAAVNSLSSIYQETAQTLRTGDTSYVDELKKMASSLSSINAMYEIQMQNSTSQLEATKEVQEKMQSMVANFAESAEGVLKYKEQVDALTRKVAELNNVYGNMLAAMQTRI